MNESNFRPQLFKARESVLVDKINKIKKTIFKLQESLENIKNNNSLKRKFQMKIAQESEVALRLVEELKQLRVKYSNFLVS
jgi:seryl-tRNA synthetase